MRFATLSRLQFLRHLRGRVRFHIREERDDHFENLAPDTYHGKYRDSTEGFVLVLNGAQQLTWKLLV